MSSSCPMPSRKIRHKYPPEFRRIISNPPKTQALHPNPGFQAQQEDKQKSISNMAKKFRTQKCGPYKQKNRSQYYQTNPTVHTLFSIPSISFSAHVPCILTIPSRTPPNIPPEITQKDNYPAPTEDKACTQNPGFQAHPEEKHKSISNIAKKFGTQKCGPYKQKPVELSSVYTPQLWPSSSVYSVLEKRVKSCSCV